ncbi:thiol reductant ABC exporter subunit CydD [Acetobacter thailandicus]|uniref:thiol reductant ABC exporter subunit CydD n=1 Tax=Acetobacter thailandicus TaxID=1502842 RepID=UPI001BAB7CC9|nr:thiol reductant ABC exporter subunit CydD [Acetobacter thailandicus]MBS0985142.1 thiol reductant ABC exporter subunit CydD [Acetobacter thailandicus]
MSNEKAAIRQWTKAQSRLGRQAARPVILLSLISSLLGVGLAWCVATLLGYALMALTQGPVNASPVPYLAGFVILSVLRGLCMARGEVAAAKAGFAARKRLREEALAAILSEGPALLRQTHSGVLATTVIDRVEALNGFFSRWLPASVLWIAAPCLILIPVCCIQPQAALILGLCGLTVPFAQALFGIGAAVASRKQFLAMVRLQARFLDRIKGIATIVLAGRAEDETQRIGAAAEELRVRTMKVLRVAFLSSASIDCAMVVAFIVLTLITAHTALTLHAQGMESALQVTLIHGLFALLVTPEFFAPLRSLALAYQDRAHAQSAAAAMMDISKIQKEFSSDVDSLTESHNVSICFDNVSFTWDPARGTTLKNISFSVNPGETLVLSGASGAGKSTIVELLLGFIYPDSGTVLFNNIPTETCPPEKLSHIISAIGQRPVLFAGTLRENILFASPAANEAALAAAIQAAAVDTFLPQLPDGLETYIGEGGFGLSGGQAQRIAIARAYLKNAPVLLLDEPTAHLDPLTEQDVFESLKILAKGKTVILATHSAAAMSFEGKHIHLRDGMTDDQKGSRADG